MKQEFSNDVKKEMNKLKLLSLLILITIPIVVMVGWFLKDIQLVQIHESFVPMQFNTALCFLLLSIANWNFKGSKFFTAPVYLFSVIALLGYLFESHSGLDTLFIEPFTNEKTPYPGRMGVSTAFIFIVSAGAVVLKNDKNDFGWLQNVLGIGAGLLGILSYVLNIDVTDPNMFSGMAIHTAFMFVAVNGVNTYSPNIFRSNEVKPIQYLITGALCFVAFYFANVFKNHLEINVIYIIAMIYSWNAKQVIVVKHFKALIIFTLVIQLCFYLIIEFSITQIVNTTLTLVCIEIIGRVIIQLRESKERIVENIEEIKTINKQLDESNLIVTNQNFELTQERDNFNKILDASPIGKLIINTDGKIVYVNNMLCEIFNYKQSELIESDLNVLMPSGQHGNHFKYIKEYYASEEIRSRVSKMRDVLGVKKGGEDVPLEINITPVKLDQIDHLLVVVTDLTIRKTQESQIKSLYNSQLISIVNFTTEGVIVDSNVAFREMLSGKGNLIQFDGVNIMDFIVDEFNPMADVQKSKKEGDESQELMMRKVSGEEFCALVGVLPPHSYRSNYIMFLLDISYQKEIEQDLINSNMDLENYAYIASHDLQEPVRVISSFIEKLEVGLQGSLDEKNEKYLYFIKDSTKRMKSLITDLLEYSSVNNDLEEENDVFDLKLILDKVLTDLSAKIQDNNGVVTVLDLPKIKSSKTKCYSLFLNLISNALKYRKQTENPDVQVFSSVNKNGSVNIHVKDNGIGIPQEHHETIFSIFRRLHTREKYSGTGVGLAICK